VIRSLEVVGTAYSSQQLFSDATDKQNGAPNRSAITAKTGKPRWISIFIMERVNQAPTHIHINTRGKITCGATGLKILNSKNCSNTTSARTMITKTTGSNKVICND